MLHNINYGHRWIFRCFRLAQEKAKLCNKPDVLESFYQQVQDAADAVQQLLVPISEQQI
jgi:hypothetical protein